MSNLIPIRPIKIGQKLQPISLTQLDRSTLHSDMGERVSLAYLPINIFVNAKLYELYLV